MKWSPNRIIFYGNTQVLDFRHKSLNKIIKKYIYAHKNIKKGLLNPFVDGKIEINYHVCRQS